MEGDLVEQIQYSLNNELVSSDIIGTSAPSIYDSNATIVAKNGKSAVLYVWYDNEYGYSHQVIRLAKYISKVRRFTYYQTKFTTQKSSIDYRAFFLNLITLKSIKLGQ